MRIVGLESRIAGGVNTIFFDFFLSYILIISIRQVLRWWHVRLIYNKRKNLRLGGVEFLGIGVGAVARTTLVVVLTVLYALYTVSAIASGFGINGITVNVYDTAGDKLPVLIPGQGIKDGPIHRFGNWENDTELGSMYFSAAKCSNTDGQGLSVPIAAIPSGNGTKFVCVDQTDARISRDRSLRRSQENTERIKPCIFGGFEQVYHVPAENGGPFDGRRIGLLFSGGDCNSTLNITCAIGSRYGCAGRVNLRGLDLLVVTSRISNSEQDVLALTDVAATVWEGGNNEANYLRAAAQFYSLEYSNSAREISFLANLGLSMESVETLSGTTPATEFDVLWFVSVSCCLALGGTMLAIALLCRYMISAQGRLRYNPMMSTEDLLDGIIELMSPSGACKFSKTQKKPLFYGIARATPFVGIKLDADVGTWTESEIEGMPGSSPITS